MLLTSQDWGKTGLTGSQNDGGPSLILELEQVESLVMTRKEIVSVPPWGYRPPPLRPPSHYSRGTPESPQKSRSIRLAPLSLSAW